MEGRGGSECDREIQLLLNEKRLCESCKALIGNEKKESRTKEIDRK